MAEGAMWGALIGGAVGLVVAIIVYFVKKSRQSKIENTSDNKPKDNEQE
jgi:biopolymer transport protein ExbB/TolQ